MDFQPVYIEGQEYLCQSCKTVRKNELYNYHQHPHGELELNNHPVNGSEYYSFTPQMFIKALLNSQHNCRCQGAEDEEDETCAHSQEISEAKGETDH